MQTLQKQFSSFLSKPPPIATIVNACNRLINLIRKTSLISEADEILVDLPLLYNAGAETAILNVLTEALKLDSSTAAEVLLSLIENKKVSRDDSLVSVIVPICSTNIMKSVPIDFKRSFAMLLNALIKSKNSVEMLSIDPKNGGIKKLASTIFNAGDVELQLVLVEVLCKCLPKEPEDRKHFIATSLLKGIENVDLKNVAETGRVFLHELNGIKFAESGRLPTSFQIQTLGIKKGENQLLDFKWGEQTHLWIDFNRDTILISILDVCCFSNLQSEVDSSLGFPTNSIQDSDIAESSEDGLIYITLNVARKEKDDSITNFHIKAGIVAKGPDSCKFVFNKPDTDLQQLIIDPEVEKLSQSSLSRRLTKISVPLSVIRTQKVHFDDQIAFNPLIHENMERNGSETESDPEFERRLPAGHSELEADHQIEPTHTSTFIESLVNVESTQEEENEIGRHSIPITSIHLKSPDHHGETKESKDFPVETDMPAKSDSELKPTNLADRLTRKSPVLPRLGFEQAEGITQESEDNGQDDAPKTVRRAAKAFVVDSDEDREKRPPKARMVVDADKESSGLDNLFLEQSKMEDVEKPKKNEFAAGSKMIEEPIIESLKGNKVVDYKPTETRTIVPLELQSKTRELSNDSDKITDPLNSFEGYLESSEESIKHKPRVKKVATSGTKIKSGYAPATAKPKAKMDSDTVDLYNFQDELPEGRKPKAKSTAKSKRASRKNESEVGLPSKRATRTSRKADEFEDVKAIPKLQNKKAGTKRGKKKNLEVKEFEGAFELAGLEDATQSQKDVEKGSRLILT